MALEAGQGENTNVKGADLNSWDKEVNDQLLSILV